MKKYIKIVVLALIISFIAFLGYKIIHKINYKNEVEKRIKTIPDFSFQTLQGNDYTKEHLVEDKNIVFVYFNTECEHCQYEASAISENINDFINAQIIFISFEDTNKIKDFAIKYNLVNKENVIFLHDKKSEFSEIFDAHHIPFILIYDKKQKLIKKINGEVKIDAITKHLIAK